LSHNVRFTHSSLHTIIDNADRLQKELNQELKHLCSKNATVLSEGTTPKTIDVSLLYFYCIRNKYIV